MSNIVRLNLEKNTFRKGSLKSLPYVGKLFGGDDDRAYLVDQRFARPQSWKVGDQVMGKVVKEVKGFVYINPVVDGQAEAAPAPVSKSRYGEYESPDRSGLLANELAGISDTVAEMLMVHEIVGAVAEFYTGACNTICRDYATAVSKIEAQMDADRANARAMKNLSACASIVKELEDNLSANGRKLDGIKEKISGEIHNMGIDFAKREDVQEDFSFVEERLAWFEGDDWLIKIIPAWPLLWWLHRRKVYVQPTRKANQDLLNVAEQNAIELASKKVSHK